MVQKYQKKPVVIEAIQFDGFNADEIKAFVGDSCDVEYIGEEAHKLGQAPMAARITIHTLEGNMNVSISDYVIKGVKGEFYPCKPNIFIDTYNKLTN